MEHELKIIVGDKPHTSKVIIDGKQIGLIQRVRVNLNASSSDVDVEIVFPNLLVPQYSGYLADDLRKNLELLKELPHVKVTLEDLKFDDS